MSTYVIGDVHGCFKELLQLLKLINFDKDQDKLIFVGDIINKGPESLKTINYIMELGTSAEVVLGNHELLFLAASHNYSPVSSKSSFIPILEASNLNEINQWLCQQKFLIEIDNYLISHAGIPHIWSKKKAKKRASELEFVLQNSSTKSLFLSNLFSLESNLWSKELEGIQRWLCIANYFTRMRLINKHGELNLRYSSTLDNIPNNWEAWFNFQNFKLKNKYKIIFGHWAALQGKTNREIAISVDTGCVWGGSLSCFCIDNQQLYSVKAKHQEIN